ncbi:MAG: insulinase family protein [Tannerella sp.]|nr:insulinase family protein [Tannerella sp.]
MQYFSHTLPSGLRMIHLSITSPVAYCGFAIHAGSRDEDHNTVGYAHFVEHLLFKGTLKRKARHILNRMENVGGELNAYTTKEETFVYSIFMTKDFERAVELISDLIIRSQFPAHEIEKERDVVLDEIQSFRDNPSELIFDDFENLIFDSHPLGHDILGNKRSLKGFVSESGFSFVHRHYVAGNMVFFSMGEMKSNDIIRLAEKYFAEIPVSKYERPINKPKIAQPKQLIKKKKTHQTHILTGGQAYDMHDEKRIPLLLLNNILGGPGLNSRLNVALREKHGLVYHVESHITSYTDTGLCSIYFGTDHKNKEKTLQLVNKELLQLCNQKMGDLQLSMAKKQAFGQMVLANENKESLFLRLGKSFLHFDRYDSLQVIFQKIESVTPQQIQEVATEIYNPDNLFCLVFE